MSKVLKRFSVLIVVLSMLFTLSLPALAEENKADKPYDKVINIVHTNDVHSRVNTEALTASIAKQKDNVLILSGGDALHGQTIATISKGQSIVKIMNAVGYDAIVPGNHDFNYGTDRLIELEKEMNFPVLAANVVDKAGNYVFKPYVIREIDGIKIGVFGIATPETVYKTNPLNVKDIVFEDIYTSSEKAIQNLKAENVDVIVALTHLGLDEESIDRSDLLAEKVKGIDLIIDGHSHTTIDQAKVIGDSLIAQAGGNGEKVGIVELYFKDGKLVDRKSHLIPTTESEYLPDENILGIIKQIEEENKVITAEVVGNTPVELNGVRENVRAKETNLSNLLADAMLAETGADLAITNGGGIRASIKAGDITKGDILQVLPFGNYVVVKEVKGSDVLLALEHGVDAYPSPAGHFAQVAGIRFVFDPNRPVGERVVEVVLSNNEKLDKDKMYKVAMNDFMAVGGDKYTMFVSAKELGQYSALDEVLTKYIASGVVIPEQPDNRIAIYEEPQPETAVEEIINIEYVVKKGDNLWRIAKKHKTTWQKLVELNNIKNPNLIYPNQIIVLP